MRVRNDDVSDLDAGRADVLDGDPIAERRTQRAMFCAYGGIRAGKWRAAVWRPANDFLRQRDASVANPHYNSAAAGIGATIGSEHIVDRVTARACGPDLNRGLIVCADD